MGQAKARRAALFAASPTCIFCGGSVAATTIEHCPPRSLFRDKAWPEGFEFTACEVCNGGSSDDDLMVAFLAQLKGGDEQTLRKGYGLMRQVHRQFPGMLARMFSKTPTSARADARRLGMRPQAGQTYQELGIVDIPAAMHRSVETLAGKLTKAIFFQKTGTPFPSNGGLQFQWFTNAQRLEHGRIVILDAMAGISAMSAPISRAGRDLKDQFDYLYSVDEAGELHMLQVVFGTVFGFVSIFSQVPGRLEGIEDGIAAQLGKEGEPSPLTWLSSDRNQERIVEAAERRPI
ncbi:hypothetical protein [Variovorax saccharolyticus]|uniref:hypothetical protein n=1 Tax=Variovorax saccharolyticus TaxID=3053516 RepID=UPI002576B6AD|nr:hypothetical protein [Variovorax sp. J31P216]MDM0025921.1 hypothetical protein [Variovorax sp. J31P216]